MTIEMKKIDITDKKYLREGWSGLLLDAFFKYISTNCENYWGEPGGEAREATEDNEKCAICTLEFSLHGMEVYASNRLSNDVYHRSSYRLPHCTIYGTFSSLEQEINYDIPVMVQFRTSTQTVNLQMFIRVILYLISKEERITALYGLKRNHVIFMVRKVFHYMSWMTVK